MGLGFCFMVDMVVFGLNPDTWMTSRESEVLKLDIDDNNIWNNGIPSEAVSLVSLVYGRLKMPNSGSEFAAYVIQSRKYDKLLGIQGRGDDARVLILAETVDNLIIVNNIPYILPHYYVRPLLVIQYDSEGIDSVIFDREINSKEIFMEILPKVSCVDFRTFRRGLFKRGFAVPRHKVRDYVPTRE